MIPLPIDPVLPELVAALRRGPNAVLHAPTGAGKTTRVPPALLDANLANGRIFLLEPRRLAARAAAGRMASERNSRVGDEIGYQVRFDRQWGRNTRIIAVTPGVLLRLLHDDPFLEQAGIILFDEFHERGLESDLALGLVRLIQQNVRPDLKIVAMSATLDTAAVAAYLEDCPVIASTGRSFPVEIVYHPKPDALSWPEAMVRAIERQLDRTPGDILAFLPGWNEIRQTAYELEPLAAKQNLLVLPLHGELPVEEQDRALLPQSRRKIVLATNVAETSVTVDGITAVVDSGLARVLISDPALGLDRLERTQISRSSADQRAGRAGRTQPGICVRLWSELNHRARAEQTEPEIRRVDLTGAILQLMSLCETDIERFPWLEPPKPAAVEQAFSLLRRLGAISDQSVTPLGQTLSRIPVHPRLGRLLIEGHRLGDGPRTALAAALLSERDPFVEKSVDLANAVEALEEFEQTGRDRTRFGVLNRGAAQFILRSRDQLLKIAASESLESIAPNSESLPRALLAAFPDRVVRRRERGSPKGIMVGGRGVKLQPSCKIESELFLAIDVDAGQQESPVRQAIAVKREWLPADLVTAKTEVEFDVATERVIARKRTRFDDLLIDETHAHFPDGDEPARILAEAAVSSLPRVLPPADSPVMNYLTRIRCLHDWMPDLNLPAFTDDDLKEVVPWLCSGCRSFDDIRKADWLGSIQGKLTHVQRQAVDREAPKRILLPSGRTFALVYELGRPPVLAVRIQEMFGLTDTPRIAGGRIRVLLHLLAPNYRPQQVTDDLASFWKNTYPQVRKELRGRYPKHAWPENPLDPFA